MIAQAPGAYRPGSTFLHRLWPGAKLLGLFAFGIAVVATRGWITGLVALAVALVLALVAGLRSRELARLARGFALVGILLFAFQTWQQGWQFGVAVVAGLFALILAASAVTASTAVDDMLDTVTRALRPLRPLGVAPERVALTFSLAIRALPLAFELARETRDAARARGLERNPRALLIPFVLRMVAHSRQTGAALQARGLDD
ncbi:MAG: energy-coupling factor transporter transmembrane protein EcfT [Leucobacter sp.]